MRQIIYLAEHVATFSHAWAPFPICFSKFLTDSDKDVLLSVKVLVALYLLPKARKLEDTF